MRSAALHPQERIYTFWDYLRHAFDRDAGLRLDHLLLSPSIRHRLAAGGVDRDVRGWKKASDHAPVWIETHRGSGPEIPAPPVTETQPKERRCPPMIPFDLDRFVTAQDGGLRGGARRAEGRPEADALDVVRVSAAARPRPLADWRSISASRRSRRRTPICRIPCWGPRLIEAPKRCSPSTGRSLHDLRLARRHEVRLVDDAIRAGSGGRWPLRTGARPVVRRRARSEDRGNPRSQTRAVVSNRECCRRDQLRINC